MKAGFIDRAVVLKELEALKTYTKTMEYIHRAIRNTAIEQCQDRIMNIPTTQIMCEDADETLIDVLHQSIALIKGVDSYSIGKRNAYRDVISILSGDEPEFEEIPECDDAVSRKYILDQLAEYIEEYSELDSNGMHSLKWCAMNEAKMVAESAPSVMPKTDINAWIGQFCDYQIEWLTSHNDIEFNSDEENQIVRFLKDTAHYFVSEYGGDQE